MKQKPYVRRAQWLPQSILREEDRRRGKEDSRRGKRTGEWEKRTGEEDITEENIER